MDNREDKKGLAASSGSRERGQEVVPALSGFDPARIVAAFRPYWERLGEPARRLEMKHGNSLTKTARQLREDGMIENRFHRGHYQWRLTSAGIAIATEVRRAETPQSGSVHEGAGPKDIAQVQSHE